MSEYLVTVTDLADVVNQAKFTAERSLKTRAGRVLGALEKKSVRPDLAGQRLLAKVPGKALPRLWKMASSAGSSNRQRLGAAKTLIALGDERGWQIFDEALGGTTHDKQEALRELATLEDLPRAISRRFLSLIGDPDSTVLAAAARLAVRFKVPGAADRVASLAMSGSYWAPLALLPALVEADRPEALREGLTILRRSGVAFGDIGWAVARAIEDGTEQDRELLLPWLEHGVLERLEAGEPLRRVEAWVLCRHLDAGDGALLEALRDGPYELVIREEAVRALERIQGTEMHDWLEAELENGAEAPALVPVAAEVVASLYRGSADAEWVAILKAAADGHPAPGSAGEATENGRGWTRLLGAGRPERSPKQPVAMPLTGRAAARVACALLDLGGEEAAEAAGSIADRLLPDRAVPIMDRLENRTPQSVEARIIDCGLLGREELRRAKNRLADKTADSSWNYAKQLVEAAGILYACHWDTDEVPVRHDDEVERLAEFSRGLFRPEAVYQKWRGGESDYQVQFVHGPRLYQFRCEFAWDHLFMGPVIEAANRALSDAGRPERFCALWGEGEFAEFLFTRPEVAAAAEEAGILALWESVEARLQRGTPKALAAS